MTDPDLLWLSTIGEVVAASAPTHGLDPDELMDVALDDDGEPIGAGVDFLAGLDDLENADPESPGFADRVRQEVEAYAARQGAVPIAAKFQEFNDDAHPHKPAGAGGGQFASTNTSSSRQPLSYTGTQQGTNKGGSGTRRSSYDPVPAVTATTTLRNDGKGTNDPAAVTQLQNMLNALGLAGLNVNGTYGDSTEAAIKSVQARLGMKPTGAASPALIRRLRDAMVLSPCVGKVAASGAVFVASPTVRAAAGHDVTPGNDELHHFWTRGKGLARWATSPTPWTTLVALLSEHVSPEKARTFASRWYIEVFKYASGSDLARVNHGKPPRGKLVGPG